LDNRFRRAGDALRPKALKKTLSPFFPFELNNAKQKTKNMNAPKQTIATIAGVQHFGGFLA
jgi:hypothetical protein